MLEREPHQVEVVTTNYLNARIGRVGLGETTLLPTAVAVHSGNQIVIDVSSLLRDIGEFNDGDKLYFDLPQEVETAKELCGGRLTVDCDTRVINIDDSEVKFTAKEFDLLDFFVKHPRAAHTRPVILAHVWGPEYANLDGEGQRTVDVHVLRVRRLIEPTLGPLIHTVRSVGYRFVEPKSEPSLHAVPK